MSYEWLTVVIGAAVSPLLRMRQSACNTLTISLVPDKIEEVCSL
jgi:hypothetical protein